MQIIFYAAQMPDAISQKWVSALQTALPAHTVSPWSPEHSKQNAQLAIGWLPPAQLFADNPDVQTFCTISAGVDGVLANLDIPPRVGVLRLLDAGMAEQMQDYCLHFVLRFFREFDVYSSQQAQSVWQWRAAPRRDKFTVLVLGLGALGAAVAQHVSAAGFPVTGYSRSQKTINGVHCVTADGLTQALSQSRCVINLLPLTPDTENFFDAARLAQLPAGAVLINIARGRHVVDADLIAALDAGHVHHAVLDVTRQEPLPAAHPFWQHSKISLTPHIAAATLLQPSVAQIAANVNALAAGAAPQSLTAWVDRSRGY